jgi:hypothetical protein
LKRTKFFVTAHEAEAVAALDGEEGRNETERGLIRERAETEMSE